jgi:hypothetical protein
MRQPCLVCGRVPSDPHHLTFTQPRALGPRVSDEFVVPVCRTHHRELDRSGNNDFVLVVAWLLAAFRPGGPYPLLAISGEQGSAKTVLSKLLRAPVDPNVAPVRALPREERELMIAVNNGHVLVLTQKLPFLSSSVTG